MSDLSRSTSIMQLRNLNYYLKYISTLVILIFAIDCGCSENKNNNLNVSDDDGVTYERENRNRNLKKTKLAYLDDLSSTQSASAESSRNKRKFSKLIPKNQELESIKESNEELMSEDDDVVENEIKTQEEILKTNKKFNEETETKTVNNIENVNVLVSKKESKISTTNSSGPSDQDLKIDNNLKFLVPYYEIYEKIDGPSNPTRHIGFIILLALLLGLLFYLMYSISSDYLTPSLAHLSLACKMSPDMAGLTFLAFGNGAPDLFTAMLGAEDAPEMILGSSIGSGLFIFTVVFGLVICFARDPNTNLPPSSTAIILNFPNSKNGNSRVKIGRGTFWRNALMYSGCVVALAIFVLKREIPMWQPFLLIVIFFVYLLASISTHYFFPAKAKKTSRRQSKEEIENGNDKSEDLVDNSMNLLEIERKRHKLDQLKFYDKFKFIFIQVTEWNQMNLIGKLFWICTSPFRLLLNLTIIPLPDPTLMTNADKLISHWFLSKFLISLNPVGSVLLLGWLSGVGNILLTRAGWSWTIFLYLTITAFMILMFNLGSGAISNPLAGTYCNWRNSAPLWIGTVYSFACCIAWIFAVSNELIAALSSLGLIVGVSRTVMGCLVLAWGNSIGDLIADLALARNGAPQTAITAIFSGPVQNVLLTIGISFMAAAAQSPEKVIHLAQLRGDVHLSLALLAFVMCTCLVLIPGYFKYRIPRYFGVVLILLYIVYVPFSLWLGIKS